VFPPAGAPTLSFIGLPWKVVPFAQFELQAKWVARALSRRIMLPPRRAMEDDVAAFYAQLKAAGVPQRCAPQSPWRLCPCKHASMPKRNRPENKCVLCWA
jgi:hypothetical protein